MTSMVPGCAGGLSGVKGPNDFLGAGIEPTFGHTVDGGNLAPPYIPKVLGITVA